MRDPHVVNLYYRLTSDATLSFEAPPAIEYETDGFRLRLANDRLTVEMIEHYADDESARQRVDPYLRSWELDYALRTGRRAVRFQYDNADVIDRDPPPPGSPQTIHVKGIGVVPVVGTATLHLKSRRYPDPPIAFLASPDAEMLWSRFEKYLEGRELLASMAYACLTFVQARAGDRADAAQRYNISRKVLGTLGRLSTEHGDSETARKFQARKSPQPLSGAEKSWVEETIKRIIRRIGEHAFDPTASLPELTMADLPPL